MQISFGNILLNLAPQSFFQLNVSQALQLYQTAVGKIDPCKVMVEAYCGIGAMSLMAADKAEKIYGIEVVPDAIANAKDNAALNHISNCEFICRDAAEGLREIAAKENVDILLADPPRSGMDDAMLDAILAAKPKKIIYISCNPATLAKNLKDLKHDYHVVTIIPFDMFPQTPQIESITVLERG
jgi:23S rRNA (uracil-5-)-methyltransferase RumA